VKKCLKRDTKCGFLQGSRRKKGSEQEFSPIYYTLYVCVCVEISVNT